jgi:hypothetical protein
MTAKWQRVAITLPKSYTPMERQAIAKEIVDLIRKRTQEEGVDRRGKPFASYSASYVKSLNFKIAGKSKKDVNLTLSGDMMGALDVISDSPGKVIIGFENGSQENGKADGNIRGTYGQKSQVGPRRDFLGISKQDLQRILDRYPIDDREASKDRARERLASDDAAANDVIDNIDGEVGDE